MYELTSTDKKGVTRVYSMWFGLGFHPAGDRIDPIHFASYDDVYADADACRAIARECLDEYDLPVLVLVDDLENT